MLDLNSIQDSVFVFDLKGKLIWSNDFGKKTSEQFCNKAHIADNLLSIFSNALEVGMASDIFEINGTLYFIKLRKKEPDQIILQGTQLPEKLKAAQNSFTGNLSHLEILDNLPINIYLKNESGKIIYLNKYFLSLRSAYNKDLLGLTASEYLSSEAAIVIEQEEEEIWKTGKSQIVEKDMQFDGGIKSFLIGKILTDFTGVGKALLCYSIDITEQKLNSENLRKEKELAEASSKAKEQFISVISHEIRTPMNTVVGMTNLLLQSQHYPEQRDYLNALKTSSDNLLAIVNDILDLSKIESGKIVFEQTDFSLQDLLENIKKTFVFKAAEKNILITVNINGNIPLYIQGDPFRLNQILLNLLSNSIKFTEVGTIDIKADILETSDTDIQILFSVIDTGIGIPENKLSIIFESFTQADHTISKKYGGTGLGLTITKRLIELQGGTIGVESKLKEGSKFKFNLKFKKSLKSQKVVSPDSSLNKYKSLSTLKLLIVEDNKMNQMVVLKFLEKQQIKADIAEDGLEALNFLKNKNYDLILMDIQMPGMDGYQVSEIIRKELPSPKNNIPIIALTAMALSDVQEKIKIYGLNDYLLKPFSPENLFSKIAEYAGGNSKEFSQDKNIQPVITNEKHTDLSYLINASDNNAAFIKQMIEIFLKQTPDFLHELKMYHDKQDWENFRKVMHKMKPTIKMMGINELNKDVEFIETSVKQQENLQEVFPRLKHIDEVCRSSFKELTQELEKLG